MGIIKQTEALQESERFQLEVEYANGISSVFDFDEENEAAQEFYAKIAEEYCEPSTQVHLHDLVANKTIASFGTFDISDKIGRVLYEGDIYK